MGALTDAPRRTPKLALGRLLAAVALLAAAGCTTISDQLAGSEVEPSTEPGDGSSRALLETVTWGRVDDLVSVLVRNPTDRVLRRADAVVTLRDSRGIALASSTIESRQGECCTVTSLRPGETYGVYVGVAGSADEVAEVEVTYRNVAWSSSPVAETAAVPVRITEGPRGSVVVADVTPTEELPSAVVQADVVSPDGTFLAVVSGTWTCFEAGSTRRIYMSLFRRVPPGSVVESVSVHPDGSTVEGCPDAPAS